MININKLVIVFQNFINVFLIKIGFKKRYSKTQIKKLKSLDVLIISPGGVGTTVLMDHISNFKKTNDRDNLDGLKHKNKPYNEKIDSLKIIYIFGNYKSIYKSLKRREYFQTQMLYFESILGTLSSKSITLNQFKKLVITHKKNWMEVANLDILFMDYDDLFESKIEIKNFLNISDNRFLLNFPIRKTRLT